MTETKDEARKSLIDRAETLVGMQDEQDYRLQPTAFAKLFETDAPTFADLLEESSLQLTARRYQEKSLQANTEQTAFRVLSNRATWAVFTATVAAALIAAWVSSPYTTNVDWGDPVALALGLVALLAGSYATMLVSRLKGGGYLARWMTARAAAETERLGYFNKLARTLSNSSSAKAWDLLLALELFRRYQLDLQKTYYRQRGKRHRQSLEKTLQISSLSSGILALGSGVVGIVGAFQPALLPLAAFGIFGSALSNVASRREEINQDERNFERYARTADILDHLQERHSEVQRALAAGKSRVLVTYINAVHEQLSLEHRQWLSLADSIASTVEQFEQSLAALPRTPDEGTAAT